MAQSVIPYSRQVILYYCLSLLIFGTFVGFLYFDAQEHAWSSTVILSPKIAAYDYVKQSYKEKDTESIKLTVKTVLFWNIPSWAYSNMFRGCEYKCVLTTDKSKMAVQSAIIFHVPTMGGKPPKKPAGQVWVYYGVEPPTLYSNMNRWRRLFNWTINYRRDSDIISRYGSFESTHLKTINKNASHIGELSIRKNRTATWFVGHCNTAGRRETFVKLLQKHMDVSIYGRCGTQICKESGPASAWGKNCLQNVEKDTRYYLSFENSLCRDYMTEKAYKVFNTHSLVPVVRGGANYSLYLPPETFIDSSRFENATSLSKYLVEIKTNKTAFTRLFENRNIHKTNYNDNWGTRPFCEMCRRLHYPKKYSRLYEDVSVWSRGRGDIAFCKKPTDLV
ncbi:alpha-(1,3)-fucosyltransferase C-like [Mizuhopecten yessoensis]|uniref:Fucosyltransferase n=1 Tax=Mizuhopecten yessoensis TaxID=6573 RepID=A0A210PHI5_MIZYE|nr:alpha-(1,3)-fucosyltransferase C-like [Mizuhopecten yessoensis]OWF35951.1 Alpha-(1,3)-fucosyltransferase C [Mizuhopecten yessoensis]